MSASWGVRAGAALMLLDVALGAFAAHGLKGRLAPESLAIWETGARYQAYHALALILTGMLLSRAPSRAVAAAGWCFLIGIFLFSGSLYLLAVTGWRRLGMVTPLGGLAFLAGWALLAWSPPRF